MGRCFRTRASLMMALVLVAAACGADTESSGTPAVTAVDEQVEPLEPAAATATPTAEPTTEPTATPTAEPTAAAPEPTEAPIVDPTAEPEPTCVTVAEFDDIDRESWRVVNDGVMGGLSLGNLSFTDATMVFEGNIETDGGGFSSVRSDLLPDLAGTTHLVIRARFDGRSYEVLLDDTFDGRDRRVSHFAPIDLDPELVGEWQTASVAFADLETRVFGTVVDDAAFVPELVSSVGIILADGIDGAFSIEIDSIEACAGLA